MLHLGGHSCIYNAEKKMMEVEEEEEEEEEEAEAKSSKRM